jgi:hypothetical protein
MHIVQTLHTTHGYDADRYSKSGLDKKICFFRTYVEAGLDAASQSPPLILNSGLRRICLDAVKDFHTIPRNKWPSKQAMIDRRKELNQSIWLANRFLVKQVSRLPLLLQVRLHLPRALPPEQNAPPSRPPRAPLFPPISPPHPLARRTASPARSSWPPRASTSTSA